VIIMRIIPIITVTAMFIVAGFSVSAHAIDVSRLEEILKTRVADKAPGVGMVIGILAKNGQKHIINVGQVSKPNGRKTSENSIFDIGSITKTFTGILLADMVLKGEVHLDDFAVSYLPQGMALPTYKGKQITLQNLATHTSGLPDFPDNIDPEDDQNPLAEYSVKKMYAFLSDYTLPRAIGKKVQYSNLGMGLLGHILALKAGMSYEELVTERILKPLGMHDTSITLTTEQKPRLTISYDTDGNVINHWDIASLAASGALRSTGHDMMLYLAANMGVGKTRLSSAIEMSHKIQRQFASGDRYIGLAWVTTKAPKDSIIWHNGRIGGYRSFIGFKEDKSFGVFILLNSLDDADAMGLAILNDQIESLSLEASGF